MFEQWFHMPTPIILAGEHYVPYSKVPSYKTDRLRTSANPETGRSDPGAIWHSGIHSTGDNRIRTHRHEVGHVERWSHLLRSVRYNITHMYTSAFITFFTLVQRCLTYFY